MKTVTCAICQNEASASTAEGIFVHGSARAIATSAYGCTVELVDKFGISFDDTYELGTDDNDDEIVYHKNTAPIPEGFIATSTCVVRGNEVPLYTFQQFQPIDQATQEIFDEHSLPRLGGASGDVGWSSISTFQKCPYLWQRQYMNPLGRQRIETPAFAFGGLMHTMLALHYTGAGITPEEMRDALLAKNVDAEIVGDVWRIFEAYRLYYGGTKDPLRALNILLSTKRRANRVVTT